jgi:outer membrane lipoprotein-sorting protein
LGTRHILSSATLYAALRRSKIDFSLPSHLQPIQQISVKIFRLLSLALLAVLGALLTLNDPLTAISGHSLGLEAIASEHSDGQPLVQHMLKTAKSLQDYTFDSEVATYKKADKKPKLETGTFSFKSPGMIRLQVTGQGMRAGSVLVKQSDGAIKAKGGNGLTFLKVNLTPDSRMLTLSNGYNVLSSDYASLIKGLQGKLTAGQTSKASRRFVNVEGREDNVHVIDVFAPNKIDEVAERIFISSRVDLPVIWETYKNGNLFSRVRFSRLKINQGLADDLFHM